MDQAEKQKVSLEARQNLVLLTLPGEYLFVQDFITKDDRKTMESFLNKVVELIVGDKQEQLSLFLRVYRKPTETILAYFSRIKNLYQHSAGAASSLENDTFGIRIIYQKVYESMPREQAAELQRLCESTLTPGTLKFSELLAHVVRAARRGAQSDTQPRISSITPNITQKRSFEPQAEALPTCLYCDEPDHTVETCIIKFMTEQEENDTDDEDKTDERPDSSQE